MHVDMLAWTDNKEDQARKQLIQDLTNRQTQTGSQVGEQMREGACGWIGGKKAWTNGHTEA